ncbi:MAG: valine--tRNA ligase [Candidatus Moranbacteria bacterium CG23_combo_of_CG06-09_8_20_14_all_41_28]|nr:MAG: valine--tRNA ligase [Candidatus Moranbacteria bacterium CG23_combo_of_CG06-09_8_20_14_all_41_28]
MEEQPITTAYNANEWENKLYALWEESGFFNPDNIDSDIRYANILPPPNANGELHLGHASGYTVMDIFGRFERMKGKKSLLLPGKDHAGIQTQVVFEKKLENEQSITRFDLGREKFYEATYDFCVDRANYMRSQEKRIGLSADWSRETFTLDTEVSRRAIETFVQMYHDGMIYRGERIINWCPRCATALSDVEVIHKDIPGKIYSLKYPLKDSNEYIVVATTRPETMLGDTAVAVHPDDERYKTLIGKVVLLPLTNREIPIIASNRIDKDFGTGAVKITPAHDPLDWEIGRDHSLEVLQVIDEKGMITSLGGIYAGLSVMEARTKILTDLNTLHLFEGEQDHIISLSQCERCKTSIEPLVSKQWFVNVDAQKYSLKKESIKALESNTIIFHPENMKGQMIHWLENLHDWCISRQLWWGHRIPVWYRDAEIYCGITAPEGSGWEQDPDTLDTWFSSGQWPYTTLGYPDTKDVKDFYPTDFMVMGRDLLFFWATRMVMFGFYKTKMSPFKHLYFTGLVRDKEGQKMSKSKGNGINVLEMIDRFGADAVRLSLTLGATPGLDFRLYEEKIATYRNFANKLWNIGRYVMSIQNKDDERKSGSPQPKTDADRWILGRLNSIVGEITSLLENYQLSLAGEKLRDFTWNEFADWYVEIHKIEKNDVVLTFVFETILKLWHPFIPYVTEAIHQTFYPEKNTLLMISSWPTSDKTTEKPSPENPFDLIKNLIITIRNTRATYHIEPAKKITVSVNSTSESIISANEAMFKRLARIEEILHTHEQIKNNTILIQSGSLQIFLHLDGAIDTNKERIRFEREKAEKEKYRSLLKLKLENKNFIDRAKPEIILAEQEKLKLIEKELAEIDHHLISLHAL